MTSTNSTEYTKPRYSMSSAGGCDRRVVAIRLGADQLPDKQFMKTAAKEGNRHEEHIAEDLEKDYGWLCSSAEECKECGRSGTHVEISLSALTLVGHYDRLASKGPDNTRVAEFKALSRFRADKLVKALKNHQQGGRNFLIEFYEYAFQVSSYAYAVNLPILYAVKNRDTGSLNVFEMDFPPVPLEDIDEHLLGLELAAKKDRLPDCKYTQTAFERTICPVAYLCDRSDDEQSAQKDLVVPEDLELAAAEYAELAREVKEHEKRMSEIKNKIFKPAIQNQRPKTISAVRLSWVPASESVTYPKERLEAEFSEELLRKVAQTKKRSGYVKVDVQ
jgi:hypothetical protein